MDPAPLHFYLCTSASLHLHLCISAPLLRCTASARACSAARRVGGVRSVFDGFRDFEAETRKHEERLEKQEVLPPPPPPPYSPHCPLFWGLGGFFLTKKHLTKRKLPLQFLFHSHVLKLLQFLSHCQVGSGLFVSSAHLFSPLKMPPISPSYPRWRRGCR